MTEILSLCNSSSQTCPPRVSTMALPINSAAPTKLIQNRYRTALHQWHCSFALGHRLRLNGAVLFHAPLQERLTVSAPLISAAVRFAF